MWNSLNSYSQNGDTLSKLKSELKNIDEPENHAFLNIIFMVLGN